tara:strand:+ start:1163 stop:1303 length:141 start_codon:yes stop_codon:yes gene_type:complete
LRDAAQKIGDDYDIRDLDAALRVLFDLRENLQPRARWEAIQRRFIA